MATVTVTNISPETSKQAIIDFFSFCGKIKDTEVTEGGTLTAVVTFENPTAMKTALLLNNTQLGPNQIHVSSASGDGNDDDLHHAPVDEATATATGEIKQEDKPYARRVAEYMAQGYVIGDAAITRAIELDSKHGVSSRFFNMLQKIDTKTNATQRAAAADQSLGVSHRAHSLFSGVNSYFEHAANTPTGQKIVKFYADGSRQVNDVHAEAMRLAELKKQAAGGSAVKAAGLERVLGKDSAPKGDAGAPSAQAAGQAPAQTTPQGSAPVSASADSTVPAAEGGSVPAPGPVDEKKA